MKEEDKRVIREVAEVEGTKEIKEITQGKGINWWSPDSHHHVNNSWAD